MRSTITYLIRYSKLAKLPVHPFSNQITFFFINKDDSLTQVTADKGENLLTIAQKHDLDMEGACDGQMACSTCHCILEDNIYESLPEPDVIEDDLLDMAYGLTPTSRLGCQVKVNEEFEGTKVKLPKATRNFYVDGFKPKPH